MRHSAKPMKPPRLHNCLRRGLLALLFSLAVAAPVLALPFQLPALVDPPSAEHHVGKVIFTEMVTPNLAAAKLFYGQLFGWSFSDLTADGITYTEATLDGRPVAGLIQKDIPAGQRRQPAWLTLLAVRDVDAAKDIALQHGAKLLFPPHDVPNQGRKAVLADPQGAVFGMLASSSGDPPDYLAEPGEWIWSSLITTDPDTDAAFYQAVFDYEVFDLAAGEPIQHLMLASHNYARGSVNSMPVQRPDEHPRWLNYIRVEDAEKTAARVVALGGQVLVAPRIDRQGGKVALVADPAGAPFGLLEWPESETKAVPK